jgi:hypothetical protein
MKESELKMDRRLIQKNLTSTDCINRYNRKIRSISEDRSIGPFAPTYGFGAARECAAGFALLNLPKGKSLGRSKPATSSYAQALQHTVWDSYYIQVCSRNSRSLNP